MGRFIPPTVLLVITILCQANFAFAATGSAITNLDFINFFDGVWRVVEIPGLADSGDLTHVEYNLTKVDGGLEGTMIDTENPEGMDQRRLRVRISPESATAGSFETAPLYSTSTSDDGPGFAPFLNYDFRKHNGVYISTGTTGKKNQVFHFAITKPTSFVLTTYTTGSDGRLDVRTIIGERIEKEKGWFDRWGGQTGFLVLFVAARLILSMLFGGKGAAAQGQGTTATAAVKQD